MLAACNTHISNTSWLWFLEKHSCDSSPTVVIAQQACFGSRISDLRIDKRSWTWPLVSFGPMHARADASSNRPLCWSAFSSSPIRCDSAAWALVERPGKLAPWKEASLTVWYAMALGYSWIDMCWIWSPIWWGPKKQRQKARCSSHDNLGKVHPCVYVSHWWVLTLSTSQRASTWLHVHVHIHLLYSMYQRSRDREGKNPSPPAFSFCRKFLWSPHSRGNQASW